MKTTLRKFLQNVQKCQRDRQSNTERKREGRDKKGKFHSAQAIRRKKFN